MKYFSPVPQELQEAIHDHFSLPYEVPKTDVQIAIFLGTTIIIFLN